MRSHTVLLCPALDVNHPFAERVYAVCAPCPLSHLAVWLSDGLNLNMLKTSCKVLPVSEMVKILDLKKKIVCRGY